jgi:uncharacterized membrane protein HdeD (DUF308 family)
MFDNTRYACFRMLLKVGQIIREQIMTINKERLQAAAAGAKDRVGNKLGEIWWAFLVRGLLALALGIGALFWPEATLTLLVQLVAVFALLDGAAAIFSAFRSQDPVTHLLPGLVSLAVGAVLLFMPGVRLLLIILGIWTLLQGSTLLLAARKLDTTDPNRGTVTTLGVIAAIIGGILLAWPGSGAVAISWLIAALAFLVAVLMIFLALRLRRLEQRFAKLGGAG